MLVEYSYTKAPEAECGFSCEPILVSSYPKCSKWKPETEHHKAEFNNSVCDMQLSFLDLNSTVEHFLFYQWSLPNDMMAYSMYFYVQDGQLHGGPYWDITVCQFPLEGMDGWWASAQWHDVSDWWTRWIKHPEYIQHIKTHGLEYTAYLSQSFTTSTNELLGFESSGYFDRDSVRWPRWGKQCRIRYEVPAFDDRINAASFKEEVEFLISQRGRRITWMNDNIPKLHTNTSLKFPSSEPEPGADATIGISILIAAGGFLLLYYGYKLVNIYMRRKHKFSKLSG
jgi:hypothetical protein